MKVKEILEALKDANPETEVQFEMAVGCCGDTEILGDADIDVDKAMSSNVGPSALIFPERVRFWFSPLDFLSSCRRVGTAKHAVAKMVEDQKRWQRESKRRAKQNDAKRSR